MSLEISVISSLVQFPDFKKEKMKNQSSHEKQPIRTWVESSLFLRLSDLSPPAGLWGTENCSVPLPSICKRVKIWVIEKEKPPTQPGTCPKGWLYFNYKVNFFLWSHLCLSLLNFNWKVIKSEGRVFWFLVLGFVLFCFFKHQFSEGPEMSLSHPNGFRSFSFRQKKKKGFV